MNKVHQIYQGPSVANGKIVEMPTMHSSEVNIASRQTEHQYIPNNQ